MAGTNPGEEAGAKHTGCVGKGKALWEATGGSEMYGSSLTFLKDHSLILLKGHMVVTGEVGGESQEEAQPSGRSAKETVRKLRLG